MSSRLQSPDPQGRELVATLMFEIDDPLRRATRLARLGGIENRVFIDVAGGRIRGEPDPTRENTSPDGKASAVQFLRFPFSRRADRRIQMTGVAGRGRLRSSELRTHGGDAEPVRAALAEDFD